MKKTILALSLLIAGLGNAAHAADTVLKFSGTCDNATCSSAGANGTVPATVSAQITLSDLTWVAQDNLFAASFTAAKDFSYQGPAKFVHAENSGLMEAKTSFLSKNASVAGITDFDIIFADGGAYFAGDSTGFGLGSFVVVILPIPINFESSTQAGLWAVASVPEPESYAMLLAGLGLLGLKSRRRSKAA